MDTSAAGRRWGLSDELWAQIAPLIPKPIDRHPLGCHRPRVPDRAAMEAILFVLRTGCQWNALNATGICTSSSAHRRFTEWTRAGVFERLWQAGLVQHAQLRGIDWSWLAIDCAQTKAPLGGEKKRRQSDRSWPTRHQAQRADRGERAADGGAGGPSQPPGP